MVDLYLRSNFDEFLVESIRFLQYLLKYLGRLRQPTALTNEAKVWNYNNERITTGQNMCQFLVSKLERRKEMNKKTRI